MKIAICEDSKTDLKMIRERLEKTSLPRDTEWSMFTDGKALLNSFETGEKFDMVFLDVDMPGLNGIEIGNRIYEMDKKTIIIFISNYPQFAIEAFDCNAFHYLLKTDPNEKIENVIRGALAFYKNSHADYVARGNDGALRIPIADICYIESFKKHLLIHTMTEKIDVQDSLKNALRVMSVHGFYQTHKGIIVNLNHIMRFRREGVLMRNGDMVVVSVRKRTEVRRVFSEYIERMV